MKRWLLDAALTVWIVLTPVRPALAAVAGLPLVDLALALLVARRQGRPWTSHGLKRTVGKILMYEVATVLAFTVETWLTGDMVPCLKLVTALVGITELKSCLEHLDALYGGSFFRAVTNRLTPPPGKPPADGDPNA